MSDAGFIGQLNAQIDGENEVLRGQMQGRIRVPGVVEGMTAGIRKFKADMRRSGLMTTAESAVETQWSDDREGVPFVVGRPVGFFIDGVEANEAVSIAYDGWGEDVVGCCVFTVRMLPGTRQIDLIKSQKAHPGLGPDLYGLKVIVDPDMVVRSVSELPDPLCARFGTKRACVKNYVVEIGPPATGGKRRSRRRRRNRRKSRRLDLNHKHR